MKNALFIIILLFTSSVLAQGKIKEKSLNGSWYACNKDASYYNADTICLTSTPAVYNCCDEVVWWLKRKIFRKYDNNCSDKFKTNDTQKNYSGKFSVIETHKEYILVLFDGKYIREKFKILSLKNVEWKSDLS